MAGGMATDEGYVLAEQRAGDARTSSDARIWRAEGERLGNCWRAAALACLYLLSLLSYRTLRVFAARLLPRKRARSWRFGLPLALLPACYPPAAARIPPATLRA